MPSRFKRPALQKIYAAYFRDNNLDGILFPTTIAPAPAIDADKGSGEMSINGDKPLPVFDTMIRNTDPGSNAGIPGLSLLAGMTPADCRSDSRSTAPSAATPSCSGWGFRSKPFWARRRGRRCEHRRLNQWLMTHLKEMTLSQRLCEERSDEAIHLSSSKL